MQHNWIHGFMESPPLIQVKAEQGQITDEMVAERIRLSEYSVGSHVLVQLMSSEWDVSGEKGRLLGEALFVVTARGSEPHTVQIDDRRSNYNPRATCEVMQKTEWWPPLEEAKRGPGRPKKEAA